MSSPFSRRDPASNPSQRKKKWDEKSSPFQKSISALLLQKGIVPSSSELFPSGISTAKHLNRWVNESSYQGAHCEGDEEVFQGFVHNIRKIATWLQCISWNISLKKMAILLNLTYFIKYHLWIRSLVFQLSPAPFGVLAMFVVAGFGILTHVVWCNP